MKYKPWLKKLLRFMKSTFSFKRALAFVICFQSWVLLMLFGLKACIIILAAGGVIFLCSPLLVAMLAICKYHLIGSGDCKS